MARTEKETMTLLGPRTRLLSLLGACVIALCPPAALSQGRMLDDCDTLADWKPLASEGAGAELTEAPGRNGKCLVLKYDLSNVRGYAIARKECAIELPANYQFTFDLKAEAGVNNFEFKLFDADSNVYWLKQLNVSYPVEWTRQRIMKRQISFAWGPSPKEEIRSVRAIEFVVSCGTGGKGWIAIDNLRLVPVDSAPSFDATSMSVTPWRSAPGDLQPTLTIDCGSIRPLGGVVIDWDSTDFATAYDVALSDDGREWRAGYHVASGNGGRDVIPLPGEDARAVRVAVAKTSRGRGCAITRLQLKDPSFSGSYNDLYRAIASGTRPGLYPEYLHDRQTYWTIAGVNGDTKEVLLSERGQIEVDKGRFSLEPFLYVDGKLLTASDCSTSQALLAEYVPVPSVTWNFEDRWWVNVEALATGGAGSSVMLVRYSVYSKVPHGTARLFVAIRPFQVNPPWQSLNYDGGVCTIDSIRYEGGVVDVDGIRIVPMTPPSGFGAAEFDEGDITEYLTHGTTPSAQHVHDHARHASAVLSYDCSLDVDKAMDVIVGIPMHGAVGEPMPSMNSAVMYYRLMRLQIGGEWDRLQNRFRLTLPDAARDVVNTVRTTLAHIAINRDGPGIQPGSRTYERSWIRDGSLTCSALLQTGFAEDVREYLDWYAKFQFPNGKVPCVVDVRGADPVPEHDSHGELIYAIAQYYRYTRDTLWLRGKFDAVARAVGYIQSLRSGRKTAKYRNGTPQERALYGILPESISHEGYSSYPRHSYWDDFFALRGLKDAAFIARALGDRKRTAAWEAERDDFRKDLYASMRLAMKNTGIDYIPGCAELGDFDATSTTIGVIPGGELGNIPEPQLHNTFDRYERFFAERAAKNDYVNYTPYETRVIGTFVELGQKRRAEEALKFFMRDRRPAAWNQWAEVVWRDPLTPKYIGDMPHTWVGSDFIRSVLTMFAYERERDTAIVLAAGIPDAWIRDTTGVRINGLLTPAGAVNYSIRMQGKRVIADVSPGLDPGKAAIVVASPLVTRPQTITLNGKKVRPAPSGEVRLRTFPAHLEYTFR
jgi:hypothetical protein